MKTIINLKMMQEKDACDDATNKIRTLVGDNDISLVRALDATDIQDAFWWFRRNELTSDQARDLRLLACDYAEHVVHIFEDKYPDDNRPRTAIEVARLYANGQATKEELEKAQSTADAAARDADAAADDDADADAADADAAAADAAASYAAYASYAAASYAAAYAAYAADAAAAERKYQTEKLRELLVEWCAS